MENLNLFIRSVFIDNMIFAYFLGMCSYLAVSKNVKTAFGLGIAVTFMLVITLPIDYMLEMHFLRPGALTWLSPEFATVDLSFLSLILFIAVIASMTQLVEMAVEKFSPSLYASLGIFLPLIAVNCAILGCSLFMQQKRLRICRHCHNLRLRIGHRMAVGNRLPRRHTRASVILQRPRSSKRHRHHIYNYWAYGHSVYEFSRN